MPIRKIQNIFLFLIATWLLLPGCSITKGLKEQQLIYTGTKINIKDIDQAKSVDGFKKEIYLIPKKGSSLGFLNFYKGLHNIYDQAGEKGFKHWVKYKLGKPPLIFDFKQIETTKAKLSHYLNGKGYFNNSITCDSLVNKKKVAIECNVTLGSRYIINKYILPLDSTYNSLTLNQKQQHAIINEGHYYDRSKLQYEQSRITQLANDKGFADFGEENLLFYVDTTLSSKLVDVYLDIIQPSDSTFHTRYKLDLINIYPNYALNDTITQDLTTTEIDSNTYVNESEPYLNHRLLNRMLVENTGEYYNKSNERKSINRLLDLGMFRYINITNRPSSSGKFRYLEQDIYLTPNNMQSITGEIELNNRSGNIMGTGASASYIHKNIFGHAEQLKLTIGGQIEAQFGDKVSFINSTDFNVSGEIAFPRFIVPFINIKEGNNFIPRSVINTNYTYQRRVEYYTLQSSLIKYGFKWRETKTKFHEFYPIVINQVLTTNKTEEFNKLLTEDLRLQQSFDDILIAGLQYSYTYSNQTNNQNRRYSFFRGEVESSGNLFSIFGSGTGVEQKTIGKLPFAQFTKFTADYRNYFPLGNANLATRIIVGAGFAYGNSDELPYIKQYLIGGSNSIRAFSIRGLGPGKFTPDPSLSDPFRTLFLDQTGDLKLEINIEYRFPIFNYFKGALFIDAGNIWLINNSELQVGNFRFKDFYSNIGIGTGLGFRLDFDYFLIRLDMAFPVREPEFGNGFQWRLSDINPLSSNWRSENLQYNIGIGYPF